MAIRGLHATFSRNAYDVYGQRTWVVDVDMHDALFALINVGRYSRCLSEAPGQRLVQRQSVDTLF